MEGEEEGGVGMLLRLVGTEGGGGCESTLYIETERMLALGLGEVVNATAVTCVRSGLRGEGDATAHLVLRSERCNPG